MPDAVAVIRPRDPGEVAAALMYAARHVMLVAVRSGGHSPLGRLEGTGTMLVDLAHLVVAAAPVPFPTSEVGEGWQRNRTRQPLSRPRRE